MLINMVYREEGSGRTRTHSGHSNRYIQYVFSSLFIIRYVIVFSLFLFKIRNLQSNQHYHYRKILIPFDSLRCSRRTGRRVMAPKWRCTTCWMHKMLMGNAQHPRPYSLVQHDHTHTHGQHTSTNLLPIKSLLLFFFPVLVCCAIHSIVSPYCSIHSVELRDEQDIIQYNTTENKETNNKTRQSEMKTKKNTNDFHLNHLCVYMLSLAGFSISQSIWIVWLRR